MFDVLRQRNFALLWTANFISAIGDFGMVIAIPLFIYRTTDSTLATAGAFAASFLPGVLFGSVAGVFVDRWDRKRTMIVSDLVRAAIVLPLLAATSGDRVWIVYVVAFSERFVGLFFSPAERTLLPRLVGMDRLVRANSLNALGDELGRLGGPAIGAVLFASFGIGSVAVVDAVTYLGSAVLSGLIAVSAAPASGVVPEAGSAAWRRVQSEWKDGLAVVRRSPSLMIVFGSSAISNISEGFFVTLALAPLVLDVLGGTDAQVGWFASAQAVGGLAAGLAIARFASRIDKATLFIAGGIGLGTADLFVFNSSRFVERGNQAVGLALFFMFLAGFPAVAKGAGNTSLIQSLTEDEFRGRVFGALGAVNGVSILLGLAIAGALGKVVGIVPLLSAGAITSILGGIVSMRLRRQDRVSSTSEA